jgi:hypothetical protein
VQDFIRSNRMHWLRPYLSFFLSFPCFISQKQFRGFTGKIKQDLSIVNANTSIATSEQLL